MDGADGCVDAFLLWCEANEVSHSSGKCCKVVVVVDVTDVHVGDDFANSWPEFLGDTLDKPVYLYIQLISRGKVISGRRRSV